MRELLKHATPAKDGPKQIAAETEPVATARTLTPADFALSALLAPAVEKNAKTQKFFTDLGASTRAPAYAERQRIWVEELLKRAQEAEIYQPEPK